MDISRSKTIFKGLVNKMNPLRNLINKYGDLYLSDTEQYRINCNDFTDWYLTHQPFIIAIEEHK